MTDEKPQVKLFLSDIFQEFPPSAIKKDDFIKPPLPGRPRYSGNEPSWSHEWSDNWRTNWPNDWAGNWTNNSTDVRFKDSFNPAELRELMLRREDFGGIAYSATSKKIYSFNQSGYMLLQKLQNGLSKTDLITEGYSEATLDEFLSDLEKQG